MVDRVVGSRQVHEDSTGDQALLIAIFDMLRQVQYLARTRFSRSKSGLFWNNDFRIHVFCYPVQYESFELRVGVTEQGDRSEVLRKSQRMGPFRASVVPLSKPVTRASEFS